MSFGSRKKGQRERNNMQTLSLFDFLIATPTAPTHALDASIHDSDERCAFYQELSQDGTGQLIQLSDCTRWHYDMKMGALAPSYSYATLPSRLIRMPCLMKSQNLCM